MSDDIISITEKKIVPWSEGYAVFVTREAKKFGWDRTTKVKVIATKEGKIIMIQKKIRANEYIIKNEVDSCFWNI